MNADNGFVKYVRGHDLSDSSLQELYSIYGDCRKDHGGFMDVLTLDLDSIQTVIASGIITHNMFRNYAIEIFRKYGTDVYDEEVVELLFPLWKEQRDVYASKLDVLRSTDKNNHIEFIKHLKDAFGYLEGIVDSLLFYPKWIDDAMYMLVNYGINRSYGVWSWAKTTTRLAPKVWFTKYSVHTMSLHETLTSIRREHEQTQTQKDDKFVDFYADSINRNVFASRRESASSFEFCQGALLVGLAYEFGGITLLKSVETALGGVIRNTVVHPTRHTKGADLKHDAIRIIVKYLMS